MPTITGPALAEFIHGAASLEPGSAGGLVPHRLTPVQRAQVVDTLYAWVERNTAGVRVMGRTDGSSLDLVVRGTSLTMGDQPPGNPRLAVRSSGRTHVVEVTDPDLLTLDPITMAVGRREGSNCVIPIEVSGDGVFEVLLPHNSPIEVVSLDGQGRLSPVRDDRPRWLHHGSSISHCAVSPDPTRPWPQQVADEWDVNLRNLSFGGNAQVDQFVARMIRDTPADLITIAFGINTINADSMRERSYRPAVHGFIDTIRDGHPTTPIVLLGCIFCPIHEDAPGPVVDRGNGNMQPAQRSVEQDIGVLTLSRTREVNREIVEARANDDPNLLYLDAQEFFSSRDASRLYDNLHPDQDGIDIIAKRILHRFPEFPIV